MLRKRVGLAATLVLLATSVVISAPGAASAATPDATTYTAVAPTRVLDTRDGTGQPTSGPIAGNSTIVLPLAGVTPIPANATAVALNLTAVQATGVGYLSAYPAGGSVPTVSTVNFVSGETVANLAVVKIGANGAIDIANGSASPVDALADVSGYFVPSGTTAQGAFVPLAPSRILDTRPAGVAGGSVTALPVTSHGVPAGVSAVVLNLTVDGPTNYGYVSAYADGGAQPATSSINFAPKQTVANLVVAPVGADGTVDLKNGAVGRLGLIADLAGYVMGGDPLSFGTLGSLAPTRLLDTRAGVGAAEKLVPSGQSVSLTVTGRGGVPLTNVSAVVLEVTAATTSGPGYVTAFGDGNPQPSVSNLNIVPHQNSANLVLAPVGADGKVQLYNGSNRPIDLIADVSGYVLNTNLAVPSTSAAHYVRDLSKLSGYACADAQAGSKLVLLDIGAQANDKSGVVLTVTDTKVSYADLVTAVQGYLNGFAACKTAPATIAVGTNNDAQDWTGYPAAARGADWANKVVDALNAPANITIAGAADIEAGFGTNKESDAQGWETAYLKNTPAGLIYNGSADGCSTVYGTVGAVCNNGWTQAQYYQLTHNGTRIRALPQIYYTAQATQWANIDATGGKGMTFAGSLTQFGVACGADCAMSPSAGWAALYHALSTIVATPDLPAVVDLRVN
ncbi:MAG: hypothetical protein ABI345_11985 [Jatrophihabitans sp.]